jgi:hypothetical protein
MEELQDAIEDAQYVNAIATQEEGPRPVLSWDIPTEEQLVDWEQKVRVQSSKSRHSRSSSKAPSVSSSSAQHVEAFSCDWYLSSAMGLFLFSDYLKEDCSDYLRINFVEEVLRWRSLRGKHRVERAKKIVQVYLKELPVDDVTGTQVLPEKTHIDEFDLCRSDPPKMAPAELQRLANLSWDKQKTTNCLGLQGVVVEEVQANIRAVEKVMLSGNRRSNSSASKTDATAIAAAAAMGREEPPKEQRFSNPNEPFPTATQRSSDMTTASAPAAASGPYVPGNISLASGDEQSVASGSSAPTSQRDLALRRQMEKYSSLRELTQSYRVKTDAFLPSSVFDQIDALVVDSLRKEYWEGFIQSQQYSRLRNFLWFQDRRVVPDDFFTMRVLGRGGFGSVIGKFSTR